MFAGFDNTMVLSMGRVAYFGKAKKMGAYLAGVGFPPAADTNPAEFILDLVNKDFTPLAGVLQALISFVSESGDTIRYVRAGAHRRPATALVCLGGRDRRPLVTTHNEHGVSVVVDLNACFFTPRLATERLRVARAVARDERVLCLFAGCGAEVLIIATTTDDRVFQSRLCGGQPRRDAVPGAVRPDAPAEQGRRGGRPRRSGLRRRPRRPRRLRRTARRAVARG